VVLTNSEAANASGLASQLLGIVLGFPAQRKEVSVDTKLYDSYVGTYQMSDFRITILREADHLLAELRDQKFQIAPESVSDYFFKTLNLQLTFVSGQDGGVTELIMHEGGADAHLVRVR